MCGIVGFTGRQQAAPILLNGLSKLEYRGYDSAGIAVRDGERLAQVVKAKGRLGNLIEKTDEGKALIGTCGIGHTRWATHGEPSQINAHPHVSGNCTRSGSGEVESEVVGVHNGIIENYTELKEKLLNDFNTFGLMFEALVERDLRIYMNYLDGQLFHFRDNISGDEVDAILEFRDGEYAAVEIKLSERGVDDAKKSLLKFYENVSRKPKFMCIIVGHYEAVVQDKETGIYIVPITSLKP